MSSSTTIRKEKLRDFVGSVEHALNVLAAFDESHAVMTLSEVAERTETTRASARRYLLTLVELGFVSQEERSFSLAPKILQLGYAYLSNMPLHEIAKPYLDRITKQTGENSAMGILDQRYIVHIVKSTTDRILAPNIAIGRRFSALYTSIGRVLVSCMKDSEVSEIIKINGLKKFTKNSIVTKEKFLQEIKKIRKQEYVLVDQEFEMGLRSIAVPIKDKQNRTIAGMNIVTNAAIIPKGQLVTEFLPVLRNTAKSIEQELNANSA